MVAIKIFYKKKRGCPKSNDCYTKCGGFDKLNHRNANLLDSSMLFYASMLNNAPGSALAPDIM